MGQQPNLHHIDREIRSLVHLLNEIPYVQTTSSCSGHPDDPNRNWNPGGYIFIQGADDNIRAFREFVDGLHAKLNGIDPHMLKFSQRINAQDLYTSAESLVGISNSHIKLIVKSPNVNRTRQEHSQMWNLVDAAVLQLEPQLAQVSLPAECQYALTPAEKAGKTEREAKRKEDEKISNELVAQTRSGDKQAYQRTDEQVRLIVQNILSKQSISAG